MAALGCDVARGREGMRQRFAGAVASQIGRFERWLTDRHGEKARDRAILAVSAMVGAMVLARAVADPALSEEILSAARTGIAEI